MSARFDRQLAAWQERLRKRQLAYEAALSRAAGIAETAHDRLDEWVRSHPRPILELEEVPA